MVRGLVCDPTDPERTVATSLASYRLLAVVKREPFELLALPEIGVQHVYAVGKAA